MGGDRRSVHPQDPNIVLACALGHAYGPQPERGLFRTADGGVTRTRLTGHGLPMRPVGKVAVAIARSNPNRVYALIETGDGVPWNREGGR